MGRGANAWREKRASSIDLDEARDEIEYTLDCAEDELSSGDPTRGEQTLYSCFTRCTELGRPFDLYRLLIAIRLGDLFFRDGFWAKAVEQYQVAYQIWDLDEHIADHVRSVLFSPLAPVLAFSGTSDIETKLLFFVGT
jgi:hypothetical protein